MTTFYMIRHGEKELGKMNPPLSPLGRKQAEKVAEFLAQFPIQAIYVSPLARTTETARIVAERLVLPIKKDARLKERMEWDSSQQTWEEFLMQWRKGNADPTWKKGEEKSVEDTGRIVKEFLVELSRKHPDAAVLLVTHGGAIRDLLVMEGPKSVREQIGQLLDPVQECSVTKIIFDGENLTVEVFNTVDHLQGL